MSTREAAVFQRLKGHVSRPEDRFDRVENGLGAGCPDVNYCFFGKEGWLEIKAPLLPAREDTGLFSSQHDVSIDQSNWFIRQRRAGGRAFLFVATEKVLLLLPPELVIENKVVNSLPMIELRERALWWSGIPVPQLSWVDLRGALRA